MRPSPPNGQHPLLSLKKSCNYRSLNNRQPEQPPRSTATNAPAAAGIAIQIHQLFKIVEIEDELCAYPIAPTTENFASPGENNRQYPPPERTMAERLSVRCPVHPKSGATGEERDSRRASLAALLPKLKTGHPKSSGRSTERCKRRGRWRRPREAARKGAKKAGRHGHPALGQLYNRGFKSYTTS